MTSRSAYHHLLFTETRTRECRATVSTTRTYLLVSFLFILSRLPLLKKQNDFKHNYTSNQVAPHLTRHRQMTQRTPIPTLTATSRTANNVLIELFLHSSVPLHLPTSGHFLKASPAISTKSNADKHAYYHRIVTRIFTHSSIRPRLPLPLPDSDSCHN
jgi:hypothetical protein